MLSRRKLFAHSSLAFLGVAGACLPLPGDTDRDKGTSSESLPDGSAARGMITVKTDGTIDRALSFLAARRHRDGSFGTNAYMGNTAATSLAALAFMAGGHQPNRGLYGKIVTDALRFILSQDRDKRYPGFLHNPQATPHGPMYGHGFATLFLAEVCGMVADKDLAKEVNETLRRAVRLILDSQNEQGGWRYNPVPRDADISVTICQIMALRAARNAGVAVPENKVTRCVEYVKRCQDKIEGWFRYMREGGGGGGSQAFARTAAGVVALYSAGVYKGPEITMGLRFLEKNRPGVGFFGRPDIPIRPDMHYFYGHYYAVQAMYVAGGRYWQNWYPAIRDELLASQRPDGSWQDQICSHYATAMACLILQIPNNYLPILQK